MSNIEMSLKDVITLLKQAVEKGKEKLALALIKETLEHLVEQTFCGYCGIINMSNEDIHCTNCTNVHDKDITGLFSAEDADKLKDL